MGDSVLEKYYIMHDPKVFNLMDQIGYDHTSPKEIIKFLTGENPDEINETNYQQYLQFDFSKQRKNAIDQMGTENYALTYIANQIVRADTSSEVILFDGKRRTIDEIISEKSGPPEAVFITSISSNFPTAVATAIVLNHAKIPVVLGGIHVSSCPEDVELYIKMHAPNPELIAYVMGPGDYETIKQVITDLKNNSLQEQYKGSVTIENGVWGNENIVALPEIEIEY